MYLINTIRTAITVLLFVLITLVQRSEAQWQARHGLTPAQYQSTFDDLAKQGYRLKMVSGYMSGGSERYAALWVKIPGPAWQARHGLSASAYQKAFDDFAKQGYRLTWVSAHEANGAVLYAAIWEQKAGPAWVARHGLNATQYQQTFDTYTKQGYRLIHVSGYSSGGAANYAAIFEKSNGPAWQARHGMNSSQYQQAFDDFAKQGYRLKDVSGYNIGGIDYYAAIWEKVNGPGWSARHGVPDASFQDVFDAMVSDGHQEVLVTAFQSGDIGKLNAIWDKLPATPQNVVTQHNDNSRSGAYTIETHLTPSNVNPATFGRLYTRNVDGDTVSQPLYMRAVHTRLGVKNLFFVTTSKNNIYAFDADDLDPNPIHGLVWQVNLCASLPTGVCGETWSRLVGITSTPVIDPYTGTLYAVARCSDPNHGPNDGAIFIHAVNVADGSDRVNPVQIQATDPKNPGVKFDFHCQRNRPGLLLSKGVVYAAFGTFSCDAGCGGAPYHGWVLGYRMSDLKQVAVFDTSPNAGEAGIWQTGNGLVAADDGSIFFQTGNGPSSEPLQDSFVKLSPNVSPAGLAQEGSFTPNNAVTLSNGDTDLGSGGPMLLPQGRLIGGGKQGRYYVLDTATMGLSQDSALDPLGFNGFQAFINTYHNDSSMNACPPAGGAAGCNTAAAGSPAGGACYVDPKRYGNGELCGPNIHGGPVFWESNPAFGLIYEMPEKDFLKAFKYDLTTHKVTGKPVLIATGTLAKPPTDGMPGGFSSISANKMKDGIVWTSMPFGDGQWNPVPGRLAAFDAATLKQLWSDDDNVVFAKSVPPTIADGKVFRATAANKVIVYGLFQRRIGGKLIGSPGRTLACYTIAEKHANHGGLLGLLGMPIGEERSSNDQTHGRFQDFRGLLFGPTQTFASHRQRPDSPMPTCSVPKGESTTVDSSIYWSPKTCAHVVQGQIRDLWLQMGGVKGELGYPVEDETLTPDRVGRMSRFEHGEIWWYPDKGAFVPSPDTKQKKLER